MRPPESADHLATRVSFTYDDLSAQKKALTPLAPWELGDSDMALTFH